MERYSPENCPFPDLLCNECLYIYSCGEQAESVRPLIRRTDRNLPKTSKNTSETILRPYGY